MKVFVVVLSAAAVLSVAVFFGVRMVFHSESSAYYSEDSDYIVTSVDYESGGRVYRPAEDYMSASFSIMLPSQQNHLHLVPSVMVLGSTAFLGLEFNMQGVIPSDRKNTVSERLYDRCVVEDSSSDRRLVMDFPVCDSRMKFSQNDDGYVLKGLFRLSLDQYEEIAGFFSGAGYMRVSVRSTDGNVIAGKSYNNFHKIIYERLLDEAVSDNNNLSFSDREEVLLSAG